MQTKFQTMKMKLLLTGLMLCISILEGSAQNLVRNPGFDGMKAWSLTRWTKIYGRISTADRNMILANDDLKQTTMAQQGVKLKPHTEYRISFRIKGENITTDGAKNSGACIMILHQGKYVYECSPAGAWKTVSGTFDWKSCALTFKTGETTGWSTLYLVLRKSTGTVRFSDVRLEETAKPVAAGGNAKLIPVCWQKNVWNLAAGTPGSIFCDLRTKPVKTCRYEIELDLPEGVELTAASPWHQYTPERSSDRIVSLPSRKGSAFRTYRIAPDSKFAAALLPDSLAWNNYYRLYLTASGKSAGGSAFFRFYADGKELMPEQNFQINVLPPVAFPQEKIKKFGLHISYLYCLTAPLPEIRNSGVNYWRHLAEKPETFTVFRFGSLSPEIREQVLRDFKVSLFVATRYITPLGNFAGWKKQSGVHVPGMVLADGRQLEWACPSHAMRKGTPFWESYVSELIQKKLNELPQAVRIVWDIEPGAKDYCYCAVCRKNFSGSVSSGKTLTAEEIRRNHAAEWFRFRVKQNAEIIKRFAELCRRKFPGKELVLCTDPLHASPPHVQEWCGVDVRLSDADYGLFMNMPYYQGVRWYDDLAFNRKSLKTPNYPLIDPSENMEMFYSRYTPEGVVMNMVAAAAQGARGIGFWPGDNFDGKYLHAIAEGSGMIADGEEYYFGERCDRMAEIKPVNVVEMTLEDRGRKAVATVPDFTPYLRFTVHKKDSAWLVTVFNYHPSQDLLARIALPAIPRSGAWHVFSLKDRKAYSTANPADGFLAEVPAGTVRQFEIAEKKRKTAGHIAPEALEKKLADFRSRNSSASRFRSLREGNCSVGWGILPEGSGPMLKLSAGSRSVYLDLNRNAAVTGCYIDDLEDILSGEGRGVMDEFNLYRYHEPLAFELTDAKIVKGIPVVRLAAVVPASENADPNSTLPAGLRIEKTVSLEDGGKTIRSVYTLLNPEGSGRTMKVGFRLKNHPRLGAAWNSGKVLSSLWRIGMNGTSGKISFQGAERADNLILAAGENTAPGELAGKILPDRYTGGAAELSASFNGQNAKIGFELLPDAECAGFLIWWSNSAASTLEPLTREKMLKPGERRTVASLIRIGK